MGPGFWVGGPSSGGRFRDRLVGLTTIRIVEPDRPALGAVGDPLDDNALGPRIAEIPWRAVDLQGEDLLLRQPRSVPWSAQIIGGSGAELYIAYLRLDPIETASTSASGQTTASLRLFAYDDTWNFFDYPGPLAEQGAEAYRTQLEAYRGTDFARIYWEGAHGDVCHYPTRVGRTWDAFAGGTWPRAGDRNVVQTWRGWLAAGFDPFALAVHHAHDVGLEIHATYRFRIGAPSRRRHIDAYNAGSFFNAHPEWRIRRPDGTPGTALSLAHHGYGR